MNNALSLIKAFTNRGRVLCGVALLSSIAVAVSGVSQGGSAEPQDGRFYNPRTSVYVSAHQYLVESGGNTRFACGIMLGFAALQAATVLGRLRGAPGEGQRADSGDQGITFFT